MSKTDWLTIDQAAALVGKSTSTVRRTLASVPPAHIRREGSKIYLAKGWVVNRWQPVGRDEKPVEQAGLDAYTWALIASAALVGGLLVWLVIG